MADPSMQPSMSRRDSGEESVGSARRGSRSLMAGNWRLTSCLGSGRATRVFRARPGDREEGWPEDYVVKLASPNAPADLALRLLWNEANAAKAVANTHLLTLLEASWGESPYLVFPYLSGGSLEARIRRWGPAPPAQGLWTLRQVIAALGSLHAAGWAHGDVKPGNVIAGVDGHATLIDLGFAHRFRHAPTAARWVMATPAYAAPEVHRGEQPNPSTDIYSLGVTAYELLSGHKPFRGDSPAEMAERHWAEPPPDLRTVAPQASHAVAALLRRMMAKDAAERPSLERVRRTLLSLEIDAFADRASHRPDTLTTLV